jgi:DNA-binding transcriptional MerR regulator
MAKSKEAFRTISEVAEWLETQPHVLRFWESKFSQVRPVKRAGGRRYYRPNDMLLIGGIKTLLHDDGMTIKGVQKLLREKGVKEVSALSRPLDEDLQGATVDETAAETKPAVAVKPKPAPKAAPVAPAVEVEADVDKAVPRKPFSKAMESMELRYKVLTRILGLRGIENSKRAQVAQSLAALKEVRNRDLETPRT